MNTSEGRTVEYARNCITSLNLFVYDLIVLFNKILDSFAEGNEFLQRYVAYLKSIRLNEQGKWHWPVELGEKRKK